MAMTSLEKLVEPIRRSPYLIEATALLSRELEEERIRREQFYEAVISEEKAEFINGKVVEHLPARNRHLDATALLMNLISNHVRLKGLGTVKTEKCLCVFPRNDYEPDIVFFGKEKSASLQPDTMKFPIPDFIVEVLSESTEARDRGVKFEDYAVHGVGESWIIDTESETVEQYLPGPDGYELKVKAATGTITSEVITGLSLPVRAIFDEVENLAALRLLM